jgi:fatty acyl-CoA reductase
LNSNLFDTLRGSDPAKFEAHFRKHVTAIAGELGSGNLIDSEEDLAMLRRQVQVVVHCAASVTFSSPLHEALTKNVSGALEVFAFGASLERLDAYCHVSTAYVNCNKLGHVHETLPLIDLPKGVRNFEEYYRHLTALSPDELALRQDELLGHFPNTYCFSKALAEHILVERARGYPLCIVRPTIVGAAASEPVPGWTDSINAVGAVTLFMALGIVRSLYGKGIVVPDVVPVDTVVAAILAAVPYVAGRRNMPPEIVHAGAHKAEYTWEHHRTWCVQYFLERPLERQVSPPDASWCRSEITYTAYLLFAYKIPLFLLENYLRVLPNESLAKQCNSLRKVAVGIANHSTVFKHFLNNEWRFDTSNLRRVWAALPDADRPRVKVDPDYYSSRDYVLEFCRGVGVMVDKVPNNKPLSPALATGSEYSAESIQARMALQYHSVELQNYIDTLLMMAPPTLYLAFKALTGTRVWPLFFEQQPRRVQLARYWAVAGVLLYAIKKARFARGLQSRVERGQPRDRAFMFETLEKPMMGWFVPFGASLLALWLQRGRRSQQELAGLVFQDAHASGGGALLRALRWLVTFGGARLAPSFWIAVLSYFAFNFVESAAVFGARPVTWSHIAAELPHWRKTLTFATFVALIRLGKGRESQGMQHWLRMWERGHM